jgi:D-sedoheptulose 7-phosphate isomerase
MLEQRIQQQFFESADLKYHAADMLARPIADAAQAIVSCLTSGGKVLACGNGGSSAGAQHLAALLVGQFERERPALAALALAADATMLTATSSDPSRIFAKQIEAVGQPGDVLVALTTSGNSTSVIAAAQAAHDKEMTVVALTGKGGGRLREILAETDVQVAVPHERTARIHEVHLLALHCLCDAIDTQLLGEQDHA